MALLLAAAMLVGQTLTNGIDTMPAESEPIADEVEETVPALTPRQYLYASYPALARRLDCVIARESRWDPAAVNRRSGATGLAQFLLSTWYTTPPGRQGLSRLDPYANIDGAAWLATNRGWQHWTVVNVGYC